MQTHICTHASRPRCHTKHACAVLEPLVPRMEGAAPGSAAKGKADDDVERHPILGPCCFSWGGDTEPCGLKTSGAHARLVSPAGRVLALSNDIKNLSSGRGFAH